MYFVDGFGSIFSVKVSIIKLFELIEFCCPHINRKKNSFIELVRNGEKNWFEPFKKDLVRGILMTACDISATFKPWHIQKKIADLVAREFFEQGDLEKEKLKQMPSAMMDREKKDELPKMY